MIKYTIQEEGNGTFATIEARTGAAALNKAKRQFPRRSCDYNGYVGPITWRAFGPGDNHAAAQLVVQVRK